MASKGSLIPLSQTQIPEWLISHRFGTVRIADRIAVLEHGAMTELGTYAELLALNGTYARLFGMQAEGYR